MLMDNTLELLGITDSNIKITRFSAKTDRIDWPAPIACLKIMVQFAHGKIAAGFFDF